MRGSAIALDTVRPQPWRNGGGVTRELVAWPSRDDWRVRVSVADIDADGPFSVLDGVVRWFAVVEGAGVVLDFGGVEQRLLCTDAPIRFDGGSAPTCRLIEGRTRDLNLMLRGASGAMARAFDHRPWSPAGDACALFTGVGGVVHAGNVRERVAAFVLRIFAAPPATLRFAADSDVGAPVGWWLQWSRGGVQ